MISHARQTWAEAVFHVLAHVDPGPLPSSVFAPRYVRWAARHAGPSETRELGKDATLLAIQLGDHDRLARVQLLAWLFQSHERAHAASDRSLTELEAEDVDRPALLAPLRALGPSAELLYCAALLELPHVLAFEAPVLDPALEQELARVAPAAPTLTGMRLAGVRPLGFCGRVFGDEIWLGTPLDDREPDAAHGSWQAAHEATVVELSRRAGRALGEREVEAVAIVQLSERARRVGLTHAYAGWYARLRSPPSKERRTLPSALARWLT